MKKNTLLIALLLLHLILLSNTTFTAWPEMISFPFLINNGFILYKDAAHAYPPLLVSIMSIIFKVLGFSILNLKLFSWTFLFINDLLIFIVIKKLKNNFKIALLGVLLYLIFQSLLEGNTLWPDTALITPILIAFYFLLSYQKNYYKSLFIAGTFLTISIFIKQTGIFFLAASIVWLFMKKEKIKSYLFLVLPFLVTSSIFLIVLEIQHNLSNFINWTFIYPSVYWQKFPGYAGIFITKKEVLLIALAILLLLAKTISNKNLIIKNDKYKLIISFALASLLSLYPRITFLHFQPVIPFMIILFVIVFNKRIFLASIFLVITFVAVEKNMVTNAFGNETRFQNETDLKIASQIDLNSKKEDRVYLLGLNSTIYQLADRLPPKPWLDNFGWYFEIPNVQENAILEWNQDSPKLIVWQLPQSGNWFDIGVYQPQKITNWIKTNYNNKGEIAPGVNLWIKK